MILSWLGKWLSRKPRASGSHVVSRRKRTRLRVEQLEERTVPALVVTDNLTPTALAQALVGKGVTVSNVQYKGTPTSSGLFTGGTGIIGFEAGVILSSGTSKGVIGPNLSGSLSASTGSGGDSDLNQIVAPNTTNDATVLEFDFVPKGKKVTFNYVFGSDEYNEFVGSSFNDVFAFFLNGKNVALIPGTTTPVSINNVNLSTNPQFYRNNSSPGTATIDTEMDGLTVVLPVVANVNPGKVNHIKLAIADTTDSSFDSNVFIQSGSLKAPGFIGKTFYPRRYVYERATKTYRGELTIMNTDVDDLDGPLLLVFSKLPKGVKLVNATGSTASGNPTMQVSIPALKAGEAIRVPLVFSNPKRKALTTFFQGYPIQVDLVAEPTPPS